VADLSSFAVGQTVFVPGIGYDVVTAIGSGRLTLLNNGAQGNAAAGTTVAAGTSVTPSGPAGANGATGASGATGGTGATGVTGATGAAGGSAPLSRTFFVDRTTTTPAVAQNGAIGTPFNGIQLAVNAAAATGLPNWAIVIEPGAYAENVTVPATPDNFTLQGRGSAEVSVNSIALTAGASTAFTVKGLTILNRPGFTVSSSLPGAGLILEDVVAPQAQNGGLYALTLSNISKGWLQNVRGGASLTSCGGLSFLACGLGDVQQRGSVAAGVPGAQAPNAAGVVSYLGGTTAFTFIGADSGANPTQAVWDSSTQIGTANNVAAVTWTHSIASGGTPSYLSIQGRILGTISVTENGASTGVTGIYDFSNSVRPLPVAGTAISLVGVIGTPFTVNAIGAKWAPLAAAGITDNILVNDVNLDLRGGAYREAQFQPNAGATVDRDRIPVTGTVNAGNTTLPVSPAFPAGVTYVISQPGFVSGGPAAFIQVASRAPNSYTFTNPGATGQYLWQLIRLT